MEEFISSSFARFGLLTFRSSTFGSPQPCKLRLPSSQRMGLYGVHRTGPRGPPHPLEPWSSLPTGQPPALPAAPALIASHLVPGRANWDRGTGLPCGKECGRTCTRSRVTKPHSSAGLIAGFAHSLLIAGSVTADLDGFGIKDLRREAMPCTASVQPAWLPRFSRQSPDSGFSPRVKITVNATS